MELQRDVTGREIHVGDIVRVFHFVGPRRRRYFMYKLIAQRPEGIRAVDICELAKKPLNEAHSCRVEWLADWEPLIVAGYGPKPHVVFTDRPRLKNPEGKPETAQA